MLNTLKQKVGVRRNRLITVNKPGHVVFRYLDLAYGSKLKGFGDTGHISFRTLEAQLVGSSSGNSEYQNANRNTDNKY